MPLSSRSRGTQAERGKPRRIRPLMIDGLEPRRLLTAVAELWADINASPLGVGLSSSSELVSMGGAAYFAGAEDRHGFELWRSDGTANGTRLVKDIRAGLPEHFGESGQSFPRFLTVAGNKLFFVANDGPHGYELWVSDGTEAGTRLVRDIAAGSDSSDPHDLTVIDDRLFFVSGKGLWASDGTEAGTYLIKSFASSTYFPHSIGPRPQQLTNVEGTLYFRGHDDAHGFELWKSDGTAAGTVLLKDILPGPESSRPYLTANRGGRLFFTANDGVHGHEAWTSDGTVAGTNRVADMPTNAAYRAGFDFASWQGKEVFRTASGNTEHLWLSEGITGKTTWVRSFLAGSEPERSHYFTDVNGTLYFRAKEGPSGYELWKSDGTQVGTTLVKDIFPGSNSSDPTHLVNAGGTLYFLADDGEHGKELWKSDGTAAGTVLVKDFRAGGDLFRPWEFRNLFALGETVLFHANDGVHGDLLYRSDADQGIVMVPRGTSSSSPGGLMEFKGSLFFSATDDGKTTKLWSTTAKGERTVIWAGVGWPQLLTTTTDKLFFVQSDGGSNYTDRYLWSSDGTASGTRQLKFMGRSTANFSRAELAEVDGTLYFAVHGDGSDEIWKSDGTVEGTVRFADGLRTPTGLTNGAGRLFFSATDLAGNAGLWKSASGTQGGVQMVKDIRPGIYGQSLRDHAVLDGKLIFRANDGTNGYEVWISDGTADGTLLLKDINPGKNESFPEQFVEVNGAVFFSARDTIAGRELWKTDGTPAGTVRVTDLREGSDQWSEGHGSFPGALTDFNDSLYFFANDGAHGYDLWKSNGTAEGTILVKDFTAAEIALGPYELIDIQGTLFFVLQNDNRQDWLWKSDGTVDGTVPVLPSEFGRFFNASGLRSGIVPFGEQFFFARDDGILGSELWALKEINVAPSFVRGPDQRVHVNSGLKAVAGWATHISNGPGDERGQELRFEVETDRPELFSQQPAIDAAGQLVFAPATDAVGTANVTVVLRDDGGTAQGGADCTEEVTFRITIRQPSAWHHVARPLDVTAEGAITAMDALAVMNWVNAFGSRGVGEGPAWDGKFYDVNDDDFVGARDALEIINHINAFGQSAGGVGEGESGEATAGVDAVFRIASTDMWFSEEVFALVPASLVGRRRR